MRSAAPILALAAAVAGPPGLAVGHGRATQGAVVSRHVTDCRRWARFSKIVAASPKLLVALADHEYTACFYKNGRRTVIGLAGDHNLVAVRGRYASVASDACNPSIPQECAGRVATVDGATGKPMNYGTTSIDCVQPIRLGLTARGHAVGSFHTSDTCIIVFEGPQQHRFLAESAGADARSLAVGDDHAYWVDAGTVQSAPA